MSILEFGLDSGLRLLQKSYVMVVSEDISPLALGLVNES